MKAGILVMVDGQSIPQRIGPLQGIEMVSGQSLPISTHLGIGVIGECTLHVSLQIKVLIEIKTKSHTGASHPTVIMETATVRAAQDGRNGVRDQRSRSHFSNRIQLKVLGRE